MSLIVWSDRLELGVDAMDDTHREFVEHLNALAAAAETDIADRLDAFIGHTEEHFGQEKQWMEELSFPPIHCHTHEHDGVLGIMREVRRMVGEGKFEVARVLARELAPWFENHAATMDNMLAVFVRATQDGVDPLKALAANMSCASPQHDATCGAGAASCETAETPQGQATVPAG
jgi:hemerythrin-like metal-binding protein